MLYSSSEGAITQGNMADIAVVFTLPVPELDEAMFSVSGPTTYNLTDFSALSPDFTSFSFSVEVPMDFFGKATVFVNEVSLALLHAWLTPSHLSGDTALPVQRQPAAWLPLPLAWGSGHMGGFGHATACMQGAMALAL